MRACIRCRFLKITVREFLANFMPCSNPTQCDKEEPCAGCEGATVRLRTVPCTRIEIQELSYFMKDWKADYERHVCGFSVGNIKGTSDYERTLFLTHGYGHVLPVKVREVYVRDEKCFILDWVESIGGTVAEYEVMTAPLSSGMEGVSTALLTDYLDRHIDGGYEDFLADYYTNWPFIPQFLKTAYRFYFRSKLPRIRHALKMVLAYNLTCHIIMVEGVPKEEESPGTVDDEDSIYYKKTMAPTMINFQVKCAMADMWRELLKETMMHLSELYRGVYSGDKLRNWLVIFFVSGILLVLWEQIQFDSHFRTAVSCPLLP